MSLFASYIEGGDEVFTRQARQNLLATTQFDVVSATVNVETSSTLNLGANASAQSINIGTGAVANTIIVGNSTGATSVAIRGGTGDVSLGANAVAHNVIIGNKTGATGLQLDSGTGGIIESRTVVTVADSANDPSAANYLNGYIHCTGGGADTWTLPTGAAMADAMPGAAVTVGDSFRCYVFNASGGTITYAAGASGSAVASDAAGLTHITGSLGYIDFVFTVATDGSEEYVAFLVADSA